MSTLVGRNLKLPDRALAPFPQQGVPGEYKADKAHAEQQKRHRQQKEQNKTLMQTRYTKQKRIPPSSAC